MQIVQVNDEQRVRGEVAFYLFDGDLPRYIVDDPARLLSYIDAREPTSVIYNTVTNIGRQQMTKLVMGETATLATYIGLTTSATTPSLGATTLTNEIFRKACSVTGSYLSYYQRRVAYFATVDFGSAGLAGEGVFDTASTGGNMWAITSIAVSKSSAQSLVVSHLIQMTT